MGDKFFNAIGYASVAVMFLFAITLAASARSFEMASEKPSQFIWETADGTFTNLPVRHGNKVVKQFTPSRDRVTPVQRTAQPHFYTTPESQPRYVAGGSSDYCREVYVGSTVGRSGAVTVCGNETAEVFEQRVMRKGDTTTTTDTVLVVDGVEVFRVRGRSWTHDPGRTVRR